MDGANKVITVDLDFVGMLNRANDGVARLHEESERGCALIGGAILDEVLGGLLKALFVQEEDVSEEVLALPNAPLASFSSRIRLCRALGLLEERVYRDFERIRSIRNSAAHFERKGELGFSFSFDRQHIHDKCRALSVFPETASQTLPPRLLFETFVGMSAALLKEHARIWHTISRNMGREVMLTFIFKLVPSIPFNERFAKMWEDYCQSVTNKLR